MEAKRPRPSQIASTRKSELAKSAYLFFPENFLRFLWDIFMLFIVLYLGVSVPFLLAFNVSYILPDELDYTITGLYFIDIGVNFNTAVYIKGTLSVSRKVIIQDYMKFWFWIDVFSALPIDIFIDNTLKTNSTSYVKTVRLLKFIRIFKLVKLIKLSKLKYTLAKIEDRVTNKQLIAAILILKLQVYVFLIAHFIACFMYSISAESLSPNNFINLIVNKSNDLCESIDCLYLSSIYWAYSTMVSVGYGDISPQTTDEKMFGIACMIMTSVTFGVILGNIGSIVSKNSETDNRRREITSNLNTYLKHHKVEKQLAEKVKMFIAYALDATKDQEMDLYDLLADLSEPLREEIYSNLNGNELFSCNIFTNFSIVFIHKLSRVMHSDMYAPNDDIIIEGTPPIGIFFLQTGTVQIYERRSESLIKILNKGTYFGEIGMFTRNLCCSSVKSAEYIEVLMITCADFDKTLKLLPEALKNYQEIKALACTGDLSVLGVECYFCGELGHTAGRCTLIPKIREENKQELLRGKNESKSINVKKIRRYLPERRPVKDKRFGLKNIKGIRSRPWVLYRDDIKLANSAARFVSQSRVANVPERNSSIISMVSDRRPSVLDRIIDQSDDEFVDEEEIRDIFDSTNIE